jgi:hypothetical protein
MQNAATRGEVHAEAGTSIEPSAYPACIISVISALKAHSDVSYKLYLPGPRYQPSEKIKCKTQRPAEKYALSTRNF